MNILKYASGIILIFIFAILNFVAAFHEGTRKLLMSILEQWVFFFVNQSDSVIIATAAIIILISILIFRPTFSIGNNLASGIIYMVGIIITKDIYYEFIKQPMYHNFMILVLSVFILGIIAATLIPILNNSTWATNQNE